MASHRAESLKPVHARRYFPIRAVGVGALFISCVVLSIGFFTSCTLPGSNVSPLLTVGSTKSATQPKRRILYNKLGVALSRQYPPHGAGLDWSREADLLFFIQLTEGSIPLASRLIERLWHPRNTILIHLDAKTPRDVVRTFMASYNTTRFANLYFLPQMTITYAGVTMLLNALNAMEYALNLARPWDYFINLSGSDYPTVSIHQLRVLLGQARILDQRVSFIHRKPNDPKMKAGRYDVRHTDPALGLAPGAAADTSLQADYRARSGGPAVHFPYLHSEAWVTAHRDMVMEAARGSFGRQLLALLASSKDPEEHFWPILTWNLPHLNNSVARHAGRGIFWQLDGKLSGQHPYYVDKYFDEKGGYRFWNPIRWQHGCLFVRKFSAPNSPLMDLIDKEMSGVHPEANMVQSRLAFRLIAQAVLCFADIEQQYYGDVLKCKNSF